MAGRYKADRNPDGTWNVRGVPVFASNRLRKVEVTKEWQERAVRLAAARFALNGYKAPLHENHHGDAAPVRRLGAWKPVRVVPVKAVEIDEAGEPVVRDSWATEADLLDIPDAEYQRIKRGELPYVSAETDLANGELHSVAMLPTQAPALKLPPITIGAEEFSAEVVNYAVTPSGARSTMRFSAAMDESKKPEDEDKAKGAAPAPAASTSASVVDPTNGAKGDAKAMDAKPDEAKMDEAGKPADPSVPAKPVPATVEPAEVVPSWAASLSATIGALADLVAKALAPKSEQPVSLAQGAYKSAQTETFSAPPAAPVPPAPAAPAPTVAVDQFAALSGKLAAIEADLAARKADDDLRAKVKPYVARCQARVPTIDADEMFAAVKDKGLSYAEAYTKAVEQYGVVAPPATFAAATDSAPSLPAEVMAYHDKSPDTFAAAKRASDLFDAAPNLRGGMSRARWIELNVPNPTATATK